MNTNMNINVYIEINKITKLSVNLQQLKNVKFFYFIVIDDLNPSSPI